jgi:tRNA(fMet)-specific endonuclease VapC
MGDVGISAITAAELLFGSALNPSERNRHAIARALESLAVAPFDLAAAHAYGGSRATLQGRGAPIDRTTC